MKANTYQNFLLTIIAGCMIVITLYVTGIMKYSYNGEDVPVKISSVAGQPKYIGGPVVPVKIR